MTKSALLVSSPAFKAGERIPKRHAYTGEGENVSPAIAWSGAPASTKEFALLCDDPDAPTPEPWVHWVVYRIPPNVASLPENVPMEDKELKNPKGAMQGTNSWRKLGWGGPMPPPGHGTHHYHFKVYALDANLTLNPAATKAELLKAMSNLILAEGDLVGTYSR